VSEKETPKERQKHPKRVANPRASFVPVGNKDLRKLQKEAWNAGWWPEKKKSGIMWQAPDRKSHVMLHGSDSDHHAYANAQRHFRDAGLDI
jgi:hypothetical protein